MLSPSLTKSEIQSHPLEKQPVVFLLALWGESYIKQFFNFSLHTLLAPGNIPALGDEYQCTFLFLTTHSDIPYFKAQPTYARLKNCCTVDFVEISDLIFDGNYSATLTLAYERGMRSFGPKMCSTYFFFLVSDYLMADGSLRNLKPYLKAGYSGITTGNFLVVEEYISKFFQERKESTGALALNSREMLQIAFPYIHPVSLGQTVTQSFTHATHANRLFWKVSEDVMIGRFYLRHMLCIKPEVDNYVIGASCDYSFIPEMCPSGNIKHIQDSDEYCVIEMAPFDYERRWVHPGPTQINKLANQLSEWTTAFHRTNAHFPIIFHSKELKEPPHEALKASEEYISQVEKELKNPPQAVRGHFYWTSCIDSIFKWILQQKNKAHYHKNGIFAGVLDSPTFSPVFGGVINDRYFLKIRQNSVSAQQKKSLKSLLKETLKGSSPLTSLWHLHWWDDYKMRTVVKEKLAEKASCVVIAFEPVAEIVDWLELEFPNQCAFQFFDLFVTRSPAELKVFFDRKKHVLIYLPESRFCELGAAIRQSMHILSNGGGISVFVRPKGTLNNREFAKSASICLADLTNLPILNEKVWTHCSLARLFLQKKYDRYVEKLCARNKKLFTRLRGFLGLSLVALGSLVFNLLSRRGAVSKKWSTSALLTFKKL